MPNRMRANAMVWMYFTNDVEAKKGKCLYCGQIISYEKSTFSNLSRHLRRFHANVMKNEEKSIKAMQQQEHYVWNHFQKESGGKAKCTYCQTQLSCPNNVVSNLIRHMKAKHPLIQLDNHQLEYIHPDGNRTFLPPQSMDDEIKETFKASASLQESEELDMESSLNGIELIAHDEGSDSVKIEYELSDPDGTLLEDDQEVIEEFVHDSDSYQNVDIESIETNSQILEGSYTEPNQETDQAPQETPIDTSHHDTRTQSQLMPSSGNVSQNCLYGVQNIDVKTAAYATSIALELDSVQARQRIIAEKLIADVLFNAKLDNLTEHSMILAKVYHASGNL
ncbi:uncharacterized protein LOC126565078 [Anopheles maculipalpis]|uniref:uncharacterized protein LOC126565078 n=1 Tax=Anopheles maculipalpis TaxID=1496333 RepID=UPI0021593F88|nr:uncharacterized protein LOC126565078 [Anopheles maculipalpis]